MDIPAATGAWIALGIVLLGLAGLAVPLLLRRSGTAAAPAADHAADDAADDLAAFHEHPPGFPGARPRQVAGWVALSAPLPAPAAPGVRVPRRALVVGAVSAALLAGVAVGLAVALAVGLGDDGPRRGAAAPAPATSEPAGPGEIEARLSFGGLVLERHAVGVTATYPELRLTGGRAELELPTHNCLTDAAPDDPAEAGCRRIVPEYAELTAPDLRVTEAGEGWEISGRFVTEIRPNGSAPVRTGRAYELVVTVVAGDRGPGGWRPAEGTLRLGPEEASTTGADIADRVNVLRSRDR